VCVCVCVCFTDTECEVVSDNKLKKLSHIFICPSQSIISYSCIYHNVSWGQPFWVCTARKNKTSYSIG
jgi:hypothetical protein